MSQPWLPGGSAVYTPPPGARWNKAVNTTPSTDSGFKVWDGAAWTLKPCRVWDGAAWTIRPVKYWDGTQWALSTL